MAKIQKVTFLHGDDIMINLNTGQTVFGKDTDTDFQCEKAWTPSCVDDNEEDDTQYGDYVEYFSAQKMLRSTADSITYDLYTDTSLVCIPQMISVCVKLEELLNYSDIFGDLGYSMQDLNCFKEIGAFFEHHTADLNAGVLTASYNGCSEVVA